MRREQMREIFEAEGYCLWEAIYLAVAYEIESSILVDQLSSDHKVRERWRLHQNPQTQNLNGEERLRPEGQMRTALAGTSFEQTFRACFRL